MNYESVPIIKMEIENMKYAIKSHMGVMGSELGDLIDDKIGDVIRNYNTEGKITKIVNQVIDEEIEYFFKTGIGRTVISNEVKSFLNNFINKENEDTKSEWFKKGQLSVLRKNDSGCCCVIDDSDNIISVCAAHKEWLESYLNSYKKCKFDSDCDKSQYDFCDKFCEDYNPIE